MRFSGLERRDYVKGKPWKEGPARVADPGLHIRGQRREGFHSWLQHVFGFSFLYRGPRTPANKTGKAGSHLELHAESQGPEKNKNIMTAEQGVGSNLPGDGN